MVFRSNVSRSPKKAAKVAPEPIPERERTAEIPPRKVQHSFIHADTKVTGDLKSGGDISVEGSVEGNISSIVFGQSPMDPWLKTSQLEKIESTRPLVLILSPSDNSENLPGGYPGPERGFPRRAGWHAP